MIDKLICTVCPTACKISITENKEGNYQVAGNRCEKGKNYAIQEIENPVRIFTTTINIKGGNIKRLPVRSKEPVSKSIVTDLVKPVKEIEINAPVKKGDIIIENILGLGIDIVASRSVNIDDNY
ncbi:DUF1667 domain-containing protein [Clostridium pasteurianum]|uniref:CxxC motif-containing protein n=1 Tax=Clostridium pasteurianum BC1 TaxID=86416 RepID=R4K939_CLOPA|nr:DUF1667 domain-containing protein [Clostridium pasteurianum]AGK97024.1 hypothetical protein Clopa_2146 [Clostridium pasteurianum BC1]